MELTRASAPTNLSNQQSKLSNNYRASRQRFVRSRLGSRIVAFVAHVVSIHRPVRPHGITSATAVTVDPPFDKLTIAEKKGGSHRCRCDRLGYSPRFVRAHRICGGRRTANHHAFFMCWSSRISHLRWRRPNGSSVLLVGPSRTSSSVTNVQTQRGRDAGE